MNKDEVSWSCCSFLSFAIEQMSEDKYIVFAETGARIFHERIVTPIKRSELGFKQNLSVTATCKWLVRLNLKAYNSAMLR